MSTPADFDGCNRKCRQAGAHTLAWGECEHASEPEPTVSLSHVYTAADGFPSIGFDTYTVDQLAELLDPVLGVEAMRARTGSVDLPHLAAHTIIHRHDEANDAPLSPPADRAALERVRAVLETEAVVGRSALEYRGLIVSALMAGETPATTEAHPAEHTWAAELYDPLAEEWVPGTRYISRDRAVNHLAHARSVGPTWKDGTPTQRRLVRASTTYTVEPETEQPAGARQDGGQS